MLFSVNF